MAERGGERNLHSEIEEIFDSLGVLLSELEDGLSRGGVRSGVVHRLFREVHTLKGVAGLLERREMSDLAHHLEDHLDRLRKGLLELDAAAVDRIHAAVDGLAALAPGAAAMPLTDRERDDLVSRLRGDRAARAGAADGHPLDALPLDDAHRRSLTEYEETRLEAAIRKECCIALVRLRLPLETCEAELRDVGERFDSIGETISTFPLLEEAAEGQMAFAVLVAVPRPGDLDAALAGRGADVRILRRPAEAASSSATSGTGGSDGRPGEATSTLRIPIERLDEILERVSDLGMALAALERAIGSVAAGSRRTPEMRELLARTRDIRPRLTALQRSTVQARLVPVGQVFGRLALSAGREARSAGKEIELQVVGAGTEIDKAVADGLSSPLLHLVRNAVDHGVEAPAERERAGKPRRASLVLSASQRGGRVVIEVSDDGRGISPAAVRRAALDAGRVAGGEPLTEEEAHRLIFEPGFSTAASVSRTSGRGVGLDAARQSIHRVKGSIAVRSREGAGTTFTLDVPMTLLLVQALIVSSRGRRFAIPTALVRENLRLDPSRLRRESGGEIYDHVLGPLPVLRLSRLLPGGGAAGPQRDRFAVVSGTGARPLSLLIEDLVGHQEVMIKPLGSRIADVPGIVGAADLGDATAILVLDPERLVPPGGRDARVAV